MREEQWKAAHVEVQEKIGRLQRLMEQQKAVAVLLRSQANISWLTAGLVDVRVLIPGEGGVACLLVLRDGTCFYLTTHNEAVRLAEEEFAGSEFTAIVFPWQQDALAREVAARCGGGAVLADSATQGCVKVDLMLLRAPLLTEEMERFRKLGNEAAGAVSDVLQTLEPGMTEHAMGARIAAACLERGLMPSVLLIAADERVRKYRHAVTREGVLRKFGMLNICARKWGLCVSITRYVHFAAMPQELVDKFAAAARVQAALYDASRPGATAHEIYASVCNAYAKAGFAGEENEHHQGGTAGYGEREWLARPGGTDVLTNNVALAWNPSIQGAKAEDTALLVGGAIELITPTPQLPVVKTKGYVSAGVLVK